MNNNETPQARALELAPRIEATCPSAYCGDRLEEMDACSLGGVGVCPSCGELVRRATANVRIYTEAEAENAHPEVLAKLRRIQAVIRAANICGCPKGDDAPAEVDACVCGGGCGCHGII